MKNKNAGLIFLALLVSANASAGHNMIQATDENRAVIESLVESGELAPTQNPDWYEINSERLAQSLQNAKFGDLKAAATIRSLKFIIGDESELKLVPVTEAKIGTQDWAE